MGLKPWLFAVAASRLIRVPERRPQPDLTPNVRNRRHFVQIVHAGETRLIDIVVRSEKNSGPSEERHLVENPFYVAPSGAGRLLRYRCYKDFAPTELAIPWVKSGPRTKCSS